MPRLERCRVWEQLGHMGQGVQTHPPKPLKMGALMEALSSHCTLQGGQAACRGQDDEL